MADVVLEVQDVILNPEIELKRILDSLNEKQKEALLALLISILKEEKNG